MKTQDFEVWLSGKSHKCKSLRECHKVFTDYQNAGLTAVGRFYVNEARVSRNGVKVGVFTYNGKFWRSTAC